MSIQCPACHHVLSTDGATPRFCSACGSSLADVTNHTPKESGINEEPTLAVSNLTPNSTVIRADFEVEETIVHSDSSQTPGGKSNSLPENSIVGPFKIQSVLGQGGMGTVYKAVHSETGQTVALKLLSRNVRTTDETVQRFQRESQIAASINHPRSTFVYQAGQHQGRFYITMELMTGGTLSDVVKAEGKIPVTRAVDYILDIISGLQSAHQVGIVHRDLKPSNCFVDQRGRVKIGDYGLAKSFVADSSLTQTGAFMGTPQYAAPEQLRASDVDERADIYAIGGTLFYLLCGRAPFVGNAAQVIASITAEKPPRIDSLVESVPRDLSKIINQTLEKDPARRPENLAALRQALLPYSTRGISSADIGRRMAAFFLDMALVFVIITFASQIMGMFSQVIGLNDLHQIFFINIFVVLIASVGCFAFQEWRFGTTLGKWLLGMRVITDSNQSPGLIASLLRAMLLPGISYVLAAMGTYFSDFDPLEIPSIQTILWLQLYQISSWIPCLICFVTARKSNGMRGVHEFVSGTRVVRLSGSLEYKRPRNVPVTSPVALDQPEVFNDFVAVGRIGKRPESGGCILLGKDKSLDRDVWIVDRAPLTPNPSWELRKSVARPARLRILDEKIEGDRRWVVTEAVKGMPLAEYIEQTPNVDWRSFRPLIRELAYELAKAEDEGTVPTRMNAESVWLDQSGHIKLLDQPILRNSDEGSQPNVDSTKSDDDSVNQPVWLSSFGMMANLLDRFIASQVVPAHVLTFRKELEIVRGEDDSLRTIGIRLGELADQPSAWSWDDRVGVMAISTGIEYGTASSLGATFAIALAYVNDFSLPQIGLLAVGCCSLIAILTGGLCRGGPIFLLTGVMVRRNKTLEPASWIRCAFRNWVTWLPFAFFIAWIAIMAEFFVDPRFVTASQTGFDFSDLADPWLIGSTLLMLPTTMMMMFGPLYAILKPSRGIQDVIAGTRLIRK